MDVLQIAQNFGFPAACLAALGFAIWRMLIWTGTRGDQLLRRHIEFLDVVQRTVVEQATSQATQAVALDRQVKLLEELMAEQHKQVLLQRDATQSSRSIKSLTEEQNQLLREAAAKLVGDKKDSE